MKKIISKIRKKGVAGCIKALLTHAAMAVNTLLYYVCCLLPINANRIVFESEEDCCDNAFALFRYMQLHGLLKKYNIMWLVEYPDHYKNSDCVKYAYKFDTRISLRRSLYLATCRYYIYDHCDMLIKYPSRTGRKRIFLTHGCGCKGASSDVVKENTTDEVYVTGKLYFEPMMKWCGCRRDALLDIGYPRFDYFFEPIGDAQLRFQEKYQFHQYNKVFLWMPTFRRSKNAILDEAYFSNYTGLPILETEEQLSQYNDFLKEINSLCVFKVHHLQAALPIFSHTYSNILMLNDTDIKNAGLQLNQMIMLTDVLITDYSSVSNDYMLLRRPIIYTIDDYELYENSRGFSLPNTKRYLVGYQVKTQEAFFDAVNNCVFTESDPYQAERDALMPIMHTYNDGNASQRILKHLNLI